jgi:hypothetical protein
LCGGELPSYPAPRTCGARFQFILAAVIALGLFGRAPSAARQDGTSLTSIKAAEFLLADEGLEGASVGPPCWTPVRVLARERIRTATD